ncbi:MAG TPA: PcfJ domain-containing protein [Thermoanaerobaculia bacterium]|jgi:hypothetical protein|nr:PcfJ domain-containing protein [Thermoanaerobaculia bacterium]
MPTHPPRPGHAFRDGKLYEFTSYDIRVTRAWGQGAGAWVREVEEGGWRGFRPSFSVAAMERACRSARRQAGTLESLDEAGRPVLVEAPLPPTFAGRKALAYEAFLASIPDVVRRAVRRFGEGHWELIRLADRCGEPFLDLVASNPALALALAFRRRLSAPIGPSSAVSRLLRRRQRDIAGRLGFPATESTAHVLRRVPVPTLSFWRLHHLRAALGNEALAERLRFAPRLNASVLRLLCDPAAAPLVTPAFIDEFARRRTEDRGATLARSVLELRELHAALERPRAPVVGSVRALERAHAAAIRELGRAPRRALLAAARPFPPPPLPESQGLEAIRTPDELWQEGHAMNSCVAAYAPRVSDGSIYFYRVASPGRATISVERSARGWRVAEIRGPSNRLVSRSTRLRLDAWGRAAQVEGRPADSSDAGLEDGVSRDVTEIPF